MHAGHCALLLCFLLLAIMLWVEYYCAPLRDYYVWNLHTIVINSIRLLTDFKLLCDTSMHVLLSLCSTHLVVLSQGTIYRGLKCLYLKPSHYAQNYADIICQGLDMTNFHQV